MKCFGIGILLCLLVCMVFLVCTPPAMASPDNPAVQFAPQGILEFSSTAKTAERYLNRPDINLLLAAMHSKESTNGKNMDGDPLYRKVNGKRVLVRYQAQGHLQFWQKTWVSACKYGGVKWDWKTGSRDFAKAKMCTIWNWQRSCPKALAAGDLEDLAKTHNGGPKWRTASAESKKNTAEYWIDIQRRMRLLR